MPEPLLTYYIEENEARKQTSVYVKRFESSEPGTMVAFWHWRLTGRQSAYQSAVSLRDSRQRMADAGKPLKVEAEFFSGPLGSNKPRPEDQPKYGHAEVKK